MPPREAGPRPADILVEGARKGKPGAFEGLVRAHQDRVYSYCARMLGDRDEALDAAQDVFLSAFRHLEGFRGDAAFSTWLLRIAHNRCLNRLRERSVRGEREARLTGADEEGEGTPDFPGREEERPDRVAETRETGRILAEALALLDPDSRSLVLLSDVEGFSYEELAESAGLPLGTVKSRLHRARMALRKMIAPVA